MAMLLLLPCLAASGCRSAPGGGGRAGSTPVAEPPFHILLITLDALRADHLGCYGYPRPTSPAMDGLAAEGVLFRQAQVPRGQTWPALSSLLTGRYPLDHGVRDNSNYPGDSLEMLPSRLKEGGYVTAAFLANFGDAIRSKKKIGLDRLARADVSSATPQNQWDDNMTEQAINWIRENSNRSTFTWVHLMNPHRPYDPPAAERELFVPDDSYDGWLDDRLSLADLNQGIRDGRIPLTGEQFDEFVHAPYWKSWLAADYLGLMQKQDWHLTFDQLLDLIILQQADLTAADLDYILSRYDAEIRTADGCVGRLLETVDQLGLKDRTLVILASDHGDELYDRNHYFFHSSSIYQGVLHVPLILRWPGHIPPAATVDSLVEITDLLPTVLDSAGLPQPEGLPGHSLLPMIGTQEAAPESFAFAEMLHRLPEGQNAEPPMDAAYSVRDARWKLVLNPSGLHSRKVPYACLPGRGYPIARQELYDLLRDPGEERNLLDLDGENLARTALDAAEGDALDAANYLLEADLACTRLSGHLTGWLQRCKASSGEDEAHTVSEEVRLRLAALGYVEVESLPPATAAPAGEAGGRAELIRTALRLCSSVADGGEERAGSLACQAEAQLAELSSGHGLVY
jgi:arylsulfatase A-like enzyme